MRSVPKYLFIAVIGLILAGKPCLAQEAKPSSFSGIDVLGGWAQANLKSKQDYHFIPLFVDFDFNLKELNQNLKRSYPGLLQFQIEPAFSYVLQPNKNIEASASFALKAGILPETFAFQPYIKAGLGGIYITEHIPKQSTQLNFCEHIGAGFHYFFNKKTGLTFEFRVRHLSNAAIKQPNIGLSSYITLMGATHKF